MSVPIVPKKTTRADINTSARLFVEKASQDETTRPRPADEGKALAPDPTGNMQ